MAKKPAKDPSFEEALEKLEKLVESMEQGDLSLEESLKTFEEGVALTRLCEKSLQDAEQKIEMLSNPDENTALDPVTEESLSE